MYENSGPTIHNKLSRKTSEPSTSLIDILFSVNPGGRVKYYVKALPSLVMLLASMSMARSHTGRSFPFHAERTFQAHTPGHMFNFSR